jgi:hypothetical protein
MPRVDWSFGPGRHPVMGAVLAGASALSATMVAYLVGLVPWWWPLAAGTTVGLAAAATAGWQDMPGAAVLYRAVCWIVAGAWSSWTLVVPDGGPWSRWPLLTLGLGTAVAAVVGTALAGPERGGRKPTPPPASAPAPRDPVAAEWHQRLRKISRRDVVVGAIKHWDPPTGFTLRVVLPDDGTTVYDLKAHESQLAAAANLPIGCNVEVLPSKHGRRLCLVRVATVNAMADTHHLGSGQDGAILPQDVEPRTINDGLPVAIYADRTPATINLRYTCGVLVGQTGSGKTNKLNVITHRVGQCVDALAWAIDLSGNGKYPRPWIRAWHEGRADAPVIDWAAVTAEDAELMCLAAINVTNGRTGAYQELMFRANDDKIPVSPEVPEIVIFVDEFGTLPDKIKELLRTISDTGRSAGVRIMSCALEAKSAYIPREMITQARERIAMRVSDEAQLQYLFDAVWSRGRFDPAMIPYEGSGLLATGAAAPLPAKALRMEPNRIDTASVALARLRPELDEVSYQLADTVMRRYRDDRGEWVDEQITDVYGQRWERTLPLMFPQPGAVPASPRTQAARSGGTTTAAPPRQEATVNLDDSARDLEQAAQRARRAREAAEAEEAEQAAADWSVVEGWLTEAPEGDKPKLPARPRVRQIVQEHRRDGIGPSAVWRQLQEEGYRTVLPTVIGWMGRDAEAGILAQPGGRNTPYTVGPNFTLEQP